MATESNKKKQDAAEVDASVEVPKGEKAPEHLIEQAEDRTDFWGAAIAQLQNEEFKSIEEAVDRVVDLVLSQIPVAAGTEKETRQLLLTTFESDPELTAVLQEVLKIS